MFIYFFVTVSGKEGNFVGEREKERERQSLLKRALFLISRERIRIHNLNQESNCHRMSSSALVELCFLFFAQKENKTIQFSPSNTQG